MANNCLGCMSYHTHTGESISTVAIALVTGTGEGAMAHRVEPGMFRPAGIKMTPSYN